MNYPQGLFDLEAFVNSQRVPNPLANFSSSVRPLQYSGNLSKDAQSFQSPLGYYQNQPYRANTRDEQDYGIYESPHMNRLGENLQYQYANNNSLLDYMQQRKMPNNVQLISANPQIPPLRSEMARFEEAQKKRNVHPQSLNVPSKPMQTNKDIINLESDELLPQMLHSARANMTANNARTLPYSMQGEDINQALLLNSLNYGKTNADYLMSQLPMDNPYAALNEYELMGISPSLLNVMIAHSNIANSSLDNIYNQMQLGQDPQLLLQLGQAGHGLIPDTSVKPKKFAHTQEPILIDDSPEHETFAPVTSMNYDKDKRLVKEEFMTKPSKPTPIFEEIEDMRSMEIPLQYYQGRQNLNNKRFMTECDPEMELMSSPEKKFEAINGKVIRGNPNVVPAQNFKVDLKKLKKDSKLPSKREKPINMMTSELTREDPIKPTALNLSMQATKRQEPQIQQIQDTRREMKQTDIINAKGKEANLVKKNTPKIVIDKISLPESAVMQPEVGESAVKAKQSPTMLYLHKKHGQIQINPQNIEQINRQPLQLKLVSGPVVKVETGNELAVPLSNEYSQVQPLMMNPLNVNQSPEKIMDLKESYYQSLAIEQVEEEKLSSNGDVSAPTKEKTVGRRKKTEPTEVNPEPVKKERKMNKLQMIRFAYQSYLEEIKKPYKISIHIDPTNPDEKIVYAKVGEGYQADVESVLYHRQFTKKYQKLVPSWNPESIAPRKLEEYYQKFGQIIGQKITNEEAALKNLQKFDMDVEKALENAKKNQLYYQNFFRLDQRVLRNRATYVS